jgi:hypothetical protein
VTKPFGIGGHPGLASLPPLGRDEAANQAGCSDRALVGEPRKLG